MANKAKLTFLGTSAQVPSRKRNHTAVLLNFNEENILIDCGEGTQRQFRMADLNPCKVTRILITHWHGDHVFGLPGFLSTLGLSGYNKTLKIYCPKGVKKKLEEMMKVFPFYHEYKIEIKEVSSGVFVDEKDFILSSKKMEHGVACNAYCFEKKGYLRIDKDKLKKLKISTGPHLKNLKEGKDIIVDGKMFQAKDLTFSEKGLKICFVLDTRSNDKIVSFVKDSNLLVSEATYLDDMKDLAKEYGHLTAKQIGKIAKKAKVDKLVLTHLSQRYEYKKKSILDEAKKEFKNSVTVKDLESFEI